MKNFTLLLNSLALSFFSLFLCHNVDAQSWYSNSFSNGGMNGQINVFTGWSYWPYGPYIGGEFTTALGNNANNIAQYATGANNLGVGTNNWVNALTVYTNDSLIVGGDFTTAGGKSANYIAQYNYISKSWSALGTGMNGHVDALIYSMNLIAGGEFTTAGGSSANYIAQWNGTAWSAMGTGMNNNVKAFTVYNGNLIAGGQFTTAGGNTANYIAQWNGTAWSAIGTGMNGEVDALTVYNGNLIAGGKFTTAGGNSANYISQWNGTAWSAIGTGMNNNVNALTINTPNLYAGGNFTTAGGNSANYLAQWNGTSWSALGTGTNGEVDALIVYYADPTYGNGLYIGGDFTTAGGEAWNNLAIWCFNCPDAINELSENRSISVYPNPNHGTFTVSMENINEKAQIEIYNALGQKVCNSTVNKNTSQINMDIQAAGVYLYRVLTENGVLISSGKFIVE